MWHDGKCHVFGPNVTFFLKKCWQNYNTITTHSVEKCHLMWHFSKIVTFLMVTGVTWAFFLALFFQGQRFNRGGGCGKPVENFLWLHVTFRHFLDSASHPFRLCESHITTHTNRGHLEMVSRSTEYIICSITQYFHIFVKGGILKIKIRLRKK